MAQGSISMQIPVKSNIAHVVALALRQQYTLIVEMLNVSTIFMVKLLLFHSAKENCKPCWFFLAPELIKCKHIDYCRTNPCWQHYFKSGINLLIKGFTRTNRPHKKERGEKIPRA